MHIAYIGLGSNLNNPASQVQCALAKINALQETRVIAQSRQYETEPVGPAGQPNYINQVIAIETALTPHALLHALQAIEQTMGRVRSVRWGARIIDCDILLYDNEIIQTEDLSVPHPEMKKRTFVLLPLFEIAPEFIFPTGEALKSLV